MTQPARAHAALAQPALAQPALARGLDMVSCILKIHHYYHQVVALPELCIFGVSVVQSTLALSMLTGTVLFAYSHVLVRHEVSV